MNSSILDYFLSTNGLLLHHRPFCHPPETNSDTAETKTISIVMFSSEWSALRPAFARNCMPCMPFLSTSSPHQHMYGSHIYRCPIEDQLCFEKRYCSPASQLILMAMSEAEILTLVFELLNISPFLQCRLYIMVKIQTVRLAL